MNTAADAPEGKTTSGDQDGRLTTILVTVEILDVTPAMAEQWLSRNPANRNMRRAVVDAYARDMTAGSWLLNGETIKIDRDGNLRDGQHRLAGVVQSGTTVPSIVVSGLDPNVTATVDAGTKRTYSDVLRIAGEQNTATLAAVTRRALLWDRGYRTKIGSVYPTPTELTDFLATQPTLRVAAEFAQRLSTKALVPASIFGLAYWLFAAHDTDDAIWFLSRVSDGDGLPSEDPIAAYRNRIVRMRVGGGRVNETEALALMINAWNAYRSDETRTKLQLPRGGLTNENFPEPR